MLLSKWSVYNSTKLKFLEEEEAKELLSKLTVIKVPILDDLAISNTFSLEYKMYAIIPNSY